MKKQTNRAPSSFKKINTIAFYFMLIYALIIVVRLFEIDSIIGHIPDIVTNLFIDDTPWGLAINIITVLSSLLGTFFLLKRKAYAYKYFIVSFIGIVYALFNEFFIDDEHTVYESVKMIFIFLFYSFMLLYALKARREGWLSSLVDNRTTVLLKAQRGCDNACPYCSIPGSQGKSDSDSIENIIANARQIAANGVKEIVISGPNIVGVGKGECNDKSNDYTFLELIQELDKVGEIDRFRFTSLSSPKIINKEVIQAIADSRRFVPHFNIRLQSGSVGTLKKMKRRHTLQSFTDLFANIKEIMPNAYVSVDIIAGFPGETEKLFQETYDYLEALDISELYVWTYYDKPNTEASKMSGAVPKEVRIKRRKILNELSDKKLAAFYKSQLGSTQTVLFEKANVKGSIHGFTENHVKVKTAWDANLVNTLHKVILRRVDSDGLILFDFHDELEAPKQRRSL